jgi:hypothetical protein
MIPDTWSLTIDEKTGVPVVTVRDELTADGLRQFQSIACDIPAYWDSTKSLWDLRQVSELPSTNEIRSLAHLIRSSTSSPYWLAIVVAQDVHFGLTRMFEMLSEQPGVERRIFRDYDQAWVWLLAAGPSAELS